MSERVDVLHVVGGMQMGGAERMAVELANRTSELGLRSALLSTRGDGPIRAEVHSHVPVRVLERTRRWDLRSFAAFRELLRGHGVRLIHSHGPGPLQYVAAALSIGSLGCRHVYHCHTPRLGQDPVPDLRTRMALRWGTQAVIGVSHATCEWLHRTISWPDSRTYLLRNGVEVGRFQHPSAPRLRTALGAAPEDVLVVIVANFRPQKDHLTALRAVVECPDACRIRLVLVGAEAQGDEDYLRSVRQAVERLGLRERVHFLGARPDVPEVLAGCDAALLSSNRESGPLSLLEYMAAGLPFVATRVGEIGLEVPEGAGGFFCSPGDAGEMARGLQRLVSMDETARRELGSRGRALARAEYDQSRTAERLGHIYEQVLRC